MSFRFWSIASFVFCALIGAVALPASASPPVVVNDPARPSPIEIVDSSTYQFSNVGPYDSGDFGDVLCFGFVNHGTQTATGVGLNFAFVNALGTVVSVGSNYPTGEFGPGVLSASSNPAEHDIGNGNCHLVSHLTYALTGSEMRVMDPNNKATTITISAVLISAREVRYADGSMWHSSADIPKVGDTVALPSPPPFTAAVFNGPPRLVLGNVEGSPVDVTDAYESRNISRTGGQPVPIGGLLGVLASVPKTSIGQGYCFTYANRDARTVKHARFAAVVVDRRGYIAGIEPFDARGPFAQNLDSRTPSGSTCRVFGGDLVGDTYMYENDAIEPVAAGQFVFTPLHVDFTDGSHWDNPTPPLVGHQVATPKTLMQPK